MIDSSFFGKIKQIGFQIDFPLSVAMSPLLCVFCRCERRQSITTRWLVVAWQKINYFGVLRLVVALEAFEYWPANGIQKRRQAAALQTGPALLTLLVYG